MAETGRNWRLLRSGPATGAWNMAVDEAILEAVIAGTGAKTLRFYAWNPPCLSLGYAQQAADVDIQYLAKVGWDLVRRPTGGRAILHTDEITYSVAGSDSDPLMAGSILESYKRISLGLLTGLETLLVPAQRAPKSRTTSSNGGDNPICFEIPADWEITADGKKLIGSAQVRRKGGVLQHGTLPLKGDITRIVSALTFPTTIERKSATLRLQERATTVAESLGRTITFEEAANAISAGFSQSLGIEFSEGDLSRDEIKRAKALYTEKYMDQDWTGRV